MNGDAILLMVFELYVEEREILVWLMRSSVLGKYCERGGGGVWSKAGSNGGNWLQASADFL